VNELPPPLIKSHPSKRVRQLLDSAALDVPPADGKGRMLVALANVNHRAPTTTNFSGIALSTTVHRLLGRTLYGAETSPFRLVFRGAMVGATAGVLALTAIVAIRWVKAADAPYAPYGLAHPPELAAPANPNAPPFDGETSASQLSGVEVLEARQGAELLRLERELAQGRAALALEGAEALAHSYPNSRFSAKTTLLKVKALLQLNRAAEASAAAAPLLETPSAPETAEVRALLTAQKAPSSASSTK
jgi:hypothetical protein